MYILTSYTAAFFFFAYAAYNFNANCLNAPADLASWVPIAFGGVCFMVACFGGWLILAPARIVKSITAIPSLAIQAVNGIAVRPAERRLNMEVELRKMFPLPFFPARKILANPEEMTLNHRLWYPRVETKQTTAEKVEMIKKKKREWEEEKSKSIWTAPFRHANKAFYDFFIAMRRTWSREGFLELAVKGQRYKLDVTGGWALDEGKALDRLVRIKL